MTSFDVLILKFCARGLHGL